MRNIYTLFGFNEEPASTSTTSKPQNINEAWVYLNDKEQLKTSLMIDVYSTVSDEESEVVLDEATKKRRRRMRRLMAKASHRKRYPCATDDAPHKAKMSRCRRVKYTNSQTIELPSTEEILSVKKEITEETESADMEKQVFRKFPKYKSQNVNKNFVRHSAKPYLVSKQLVQPSKR